jgi:hypothetical protein
MPGAYIPPQNINSSTAIDASPAMQTINPNYGASRGLFEKKVERGNEVLYGIKAMIR